MAPAPDVTLATPAPVIKYVAPATPETVNAYVEPAPVIEYIAPSPAVFYPSFSQQLPLFDTNEVVAVEASAPQDVGSLLPSDEQIVDIPIPRGVEDIIEDQTSDAPVPQTVWRRFLMKNLMKPARCWPWSRLISVRPNMRLELYAEVSGQVYDANLVSEARQTYESMKVIIGNMIREIECPPVPATSRCCWTPERGDVFFFSTNRQKS